MAFAVAGLKTQIYNNQIKSVLLLAGFPVLLALMGGTFAGGADALLQSSGGRTIDWTRAVNAGADAVFQYAPYAICAAAVWFCIAFFAHGAMMRGATGSVPVTRAQMPKIYNMLENLCISRGIKMPQFEVIDSPALNAFATGIGDSSYKIVLSRGIIEKLSDDELEAVIGHELTHIINRDVRLLIISVIFVGIISFLAEMAFRMLVHGGRPNFYARGNRDKGGGGLVLMLLGVAILAVGYVLALAIRFALSRRREYLADAGSVELTNNPSAMMRALMRISGKDRITGMPIEVQQMCIENSHNFMGIFATHPKIEDRINAISAMTGEPVPALPVTLRRVPRGPWDNGPA
jgi:heat shock protein HtpX